MLNTYELWSAADAKFTENLYLLYECASPSGRPAMLMATNGDRAMPMAHCSVANFGPVSFGGRPSNAAGELHG